MRLSRTDLVPMLTIIAGGAIGFSLSVGILMTSLVLLSRSDDVPAPDPVVVPSASAEALRLEEQKAAMARKLLRFLEQRDIEAAMDRLAEARESRTPLQVRPMGGMLQRRLGLTPEEWKERR